MIGLVERHLHACERFSHIVAQAEGRWERRSPCPGWDARAVVEHVIGFHDVLLLRPLEAKPHRPKEDPVERWAVTLAAMDSALRSIAEDPHPPVRDMAIPDLGRLLPVLTAEVLVHSWDLALAIGVDSNLDPDLCEVALAFVLPSDQQLRDSGMFGPSISVPDDADPVTKLVAYMGRDPSWSGPQA